MRPLERTGTGFWLSWSGEQRCNVQGGNANILGVAMRTGSVCFCMTSFAARRLPLTSIHLLLLTRTRPFARSVDTRVRRLHGRSSNDLIRCWTRAKQECGSGNVTRRRRTQPSGGRARAVNSLGFRIDVVDVLALRWSPITAPSEVESVETLERDLHEWEPRIPFDCRRNSKIEG